MYKLTQQDVDTFNIIKASHPELITNDVDVVPVPNGTLEGNAFIPDGTYSLDLSCFAPKANDFLNDLNNHGFFNNLPTT